MTKLEKSASIDMVKRRPNPSAAEPGDWLLRALDDWGEGVAVCDWGEGVAVCGPGGIEIESANVAFHRLCGYGPDELPSWAELLAPEAQAVLRDVLAGPPSGSAETTRLETALARRDGTRVDVEMAVRLLASDHGPRLVAIVRGLAERRRVEALRASEDELRTLLASMTDVILVLDSEGRYLKIAPTNPALLYRPAEELIGKTLHQVFPPERADTFLAYVRRALQTREAVQAEYRLPIGFEDTWFSVIITPMPQGDRVLWVARDITDRKRAEADRETLLERERAARARAEAEVAERQRAEAALRESEARYRSMFENSHAVMLLIDPATAEIVDANPAACRFYGYSRDALCARKITDINTLPSEQTRQRMAQARGGEEQHFQFRHRLANGAVRDVDVCSGPVKIRGRQILYSIIHDVTERKRAEDKVRLLLATTQAIDEAPDFHAALEECLRQVCEAIGWDYGGAWIPCAGGDVLELSPAWYGRDPRLQAFRANAQGFDVPPEGRFLGWAWSTKGPVWMGRLPSDAAAFLRAESAREAGLQSGVAVPIVAGDEVLAVLEFFTFESPPEDSGLLQTVAAVATQLGGLLQRKRAEEALRVSEARNRALLEAIPDGLFRLSSEGVYLEYLPAEGFEPLVPPAEFLGKRIEDVMPPDTARQQMHHLSLAVRTGEPQIFNTVLSQGGEPRQFETRLVICGPDEALAMVRDVTERQRAEVALVAEKERLAVTLRSIGEGVIATDDRGTIVLTNPVAETLTGWADAQAEGQPVKDVFRLLHEATRKPVENPVERVLRTGERVDFSSGPSLLLARHGVERTVAHSAAPIRDRAGNLRGAVLVFGDVTDQRRIEEELAKASKLESIGVLAGGIAHDFNNLLAAVLANVSLVRMRTDPADKSFERLTLAETAALRAKDLTQRLLTFAGGGAPVRKRTVIDALVKEYTGLALAGSNVRPEFEIPDDLWPAEVDTGQVGQVIQNLVLNAQQAMPGGGTVRVRVENARVAAGDSTPLVPGPYLKASVSDDGEGIPAERMEHLFDPFYSTKPNHSGLGLSTVYSIVRKHGGHIAVESTPGLGSTFTVFLPAERPSLTDSSCTESPASPR